MAKRVRIVAGLTLKNLHPKVWDPESPYYLPDLDAVMVSYAEFHRSQSQQRKALETGLHHSLGIGEKISVYLDNGAFSFMREERDISRCDYERFVVQARPDWYAIPQDYIPTPHMTDDQQRRCLQRTMEVNRSYGHDGFVPVVHISRRIDEYLSELLSHDQLRRKPIIGLGAIVPNLLRAPKAMAYEEVLTKLRRARADLAGRQLHFFGIGGTATLHIAALLGVDSVDSSGWRNRAARGIVQLPGSGDRVVANLGKWRGRIPSPAEENILTSCRCPACRQFGLEGLRTDGLTGFCNRATHNLWVLLQETRQIEEHLANGKYASWYRHHLDNSVYLPLVRHVLA